MTDSATGIGATDQTATAATGVGNSGQGNGNDSKGSGVVSGSDSQGANSGNPDLDWAKAKGWVAEDGSYKSAEILKAHRSLETALSSSVRMPGDKATPEEWDTFHKKMGWPGDSSKYEFTADNLPKDVPYNQGLADNFKSWANEAKLPVKTAAALHDRFVKFAADQFANDVKAFEADTVKRATAAHSSFVKEWGDPATEAYKTNQEAARRALRSDPKLAGLEVALKSSGLLTKDGNFTLFEIGHLLAQHGRQFMNDKFVSPNGNGRVEANPFAKTGADEKPNPAYNMTEAARLVKQNPELARQLIIAAGDDPKAYNL